MERETSIKEARLIMGPNFIGRDELVSITNKIPLKITEESPKIHFSIDTLKEKQKDYLLILGVSSLRNNELLNLLNLRSIFGYDPEVSEPCFYNQDWYLNETFVNKTLENSWYLIKKNIFEESRSKAPYILEKWYNFPSAILCAYAFFVYWYHHNDILWKHDYIWCSDQDCNGDRIYVGRYTDAKNKNKNGFSIHRHLSLKSNYGSITLV